MEGHICKIEGCNNILNKTSGRICQAHRSRFFRHKSYDISTNWTLLKKGRPCITPLGYMRIFVNGKRVLQHRLIMEQHLGRKLKKGERIHHINGNKTDNRIENLKLFKNNAEHMHNGHSIMWDKRKDKYSTDTINKIFKSLKKPSDPSNNCFCGNKFEAKNLCSKHYQWAYYHKFI